MIDAWRGPAPLTDARLAAYLGAIFEAGRAPATAALAVAAVRFRAKLAGQPAPAGEATARVLGGYRRTAAPLRADGLDFLSTGPRFSPPRRVHHGSHAGRQLENRPHGRSLLGRRDRRTRGRRTVSVKAGTGGTPRQQYGINRASLRDEFPLSGDRASGRGSVSSSRSRTRRQQVLGKFQRRDRLFPRDGGKVVDEAFQVVAAGPARHRARARAYRSERIVVMKWLVTYVPVSRKTRRRVGKSRTEVDPDFRTSS